MSPTFQAPEVMDLTNISSIYSSLYSETGSHSPHITQKRKLKTQKELCPWLLEIISSSNLGMIYRTTFLLACLSLIRGLDRLDRIGEGDQIFWKE